MNFLPGKRYLTRDGGVATPRNKDRGMWLGTFIPGEGKSGAWYEDGRAYWDGRHDGDNSADIISDIPLPDDAPALTAQEWALAARGLYEVAANAIGLHGATQYRALADKLSTMAKVRP